LNKNLHRKSRRKSKRQSIRKSRRKSKRQSARKSPRKSKRQSIRKSRRKSKNDAGIRKWLSNLFRNRTTAIHPEQQHVQPVSTGEGPEESITISENREHETTIDRVNPRNRVIPSNHSDYEAEAPPLDR